MVVFLALFATGEVSGTTTPGVAMPLTDTAVRNVKPKEKDYKLADEKSMFLLITQAGGKLWRLKYRFGGKQKLLALGKYSEITLKEARKRRDAARKLLARGGYRPKRSPQGREGRQGSGNHQYL